MHSSDTMNIDFAKDYILEDERVLLRPLQLGDDAHLNIFYEQEPDLRKYFPIGSAPVDHGMKYYVEQAVQARVNGLHYSFIVFDKIKNAYVGSTRYYDIFPVHNVLSIGNTWYGKEFQGTGLNKHAKYLLLQFAFENIGAVRVQFEADNTNEKSIAAMKSIGCTVEGVLRSNRAMHGRRRDTIVLSILKEEWLQHVKDHLRRKL